MKNENNLLTLEDIENVCDRYLLKKYKLFYADEGVPYNIKTQERFDDRDSYLYFLKTNYFLAKNNINTITELEDLLLNYSNQALALSSQYKIKQDFSTVDICYPILYKKIMLDRLKNNIIFSHCHIVILSCMIKSGSI